MKTLVDAQLEVCRTLRSQRVPGVAGQIASSRSPRDVRSALLRERPLLDRFVALRTTGPDPAALRAEVIEEGWQDGKRKSTNRAKFFPELARMHGASGDLGTG